MVLICKNLDFLHELVKIGSVILENKIIQFLQCIFTFSLLAPLGKRHGSSLEQTWILFIQGCFVPSLVKIGPVILEKIVFNFVNVSSLFRYYQPFERMGPFNWKTWISFTKWCLVPCSVEITPVVLKRRFFNFVNVFLLHRY